MTELLSLSDKAVEPYFLGERLLRHYNEPGEGLFIAESPNVISRALDAGYQPVSFLVQRRYAENVMNGILDRFDVPVYTGSDELLSGIRGFDMVRGALCAMKRRPLPAVGEVLDGVSRVAVLENIVNPSNTGAVFRSAAALGMEAVLLSHGSADPLSRRAARVAMGTVFQIPWTYYDDIAEIKSCGFTLAALALTDSAVSIDDCGLENTDRLAVVTGTEGEGLSAETIAACDMSVIIPMYNGVDSLNAAAASAVAFYRLGKRRF